jgi:mRNA interferase RelE/StbE
VAYSVVLAPVADRQFRKLPILLQKQLKPEIDALASDPRSEGTVKVKGEPNLYRIRVGRYRIVYYVLDRDREVMMVKIGHRREVYR